MKKTHAKSIQRKLWSAYFLMLIIIFLLFMVFYITTQSREIENEALQSLEINLGQISTIMDDEINTLNTVAQNILFSTSISEHFTKHFTAYGGNFLSPQEAFSKAENTKQLIDLLTSVIGPKQPISQVYLYSYESGAFGTGLISGAINESFRDKPWFSDLLESPRNIYVHCTPDERLGRFFTSRKELPFLSFCSLYYNNYSVVQGAIEVKKPITSLKNRIGHTGNLYGEGVYIYNSDLEIIYPQEKYGTLISAEPFFAGRLQNADSAQGGVCRLSDNEYITFYTTSDYTGYTTLINISKQQLLAPINNFIRGNLVVFLIVTALTFLLSFFITKGITTPIKKIHAHIKSFQYDLAEGKPVKLSPATDTNIVELNTFYTALTEMQKQVLDSMEREELLHNQEMQSHVLALQSQMNPHFLFNSLAAIQSMADENMTDEIISTCQSISHILRYITSGKELLTPLSEEIPIMQDYLQCMKIRYGEDLLYYVNIPSELYAIKVPRLCLQLIIENSIKYSTKEVKPPWLINVTGSCDAAHWEITIRDNGGGFEDEVLKRLHSQIDTINSTGLLPKLELNGMGLLNVYIRLKMLYKDNHIFKIHNHTNGGAVVTIGGQYGNEFHRFGGRG